MSQKKLMLLGGIHYLIPVIEAAHKQGYYVITVDYIPDNQAHKYSDEYINVSIIDKEAVLNVAREKQIDGILSHAVDPGVVTASYVQEKMGLPAFGPYESVEILQNKDKFRAFLRDNGFNVPWAFGFTSVQDAFQSKDKFKYPMIVKPTDSAGSKGCTRVDDEEHLMPALQRAMDHSHVGHIIVEEFIEQSGCSSDSDCFSEKGELKFVSFSSQRFDSNAANPYVPCTYSWGSTYTKEQEKELTSDIQRLLTLLHMNTSVYNIETRVGKNGKPYIMEVSPRGGGNRICEVLRLATGVDLITTVVRAAVGDPIEEVKQKPYVGLWANVILHSEKEGKFVRLDIDEEIRKKYVYEEDLWVKPGDHIDSFNGANNTIGFVFFKFDTEENREKYLIRQNEWLHVVVE